MKTKIYSLDSRKRISLANLKNKNACGKRTPEQCRKIREGTIKSYLNRSSWIKGLTKETNHIVRKIAEQKIGTKRSRETRLLQSKVRINRFIRECNGSIPSRKRPAFWNEVLKEIIRERDNYCCQICWGHEDNLSRDLDVHHIDYNKLNCSTNNLISLCLRCHAKTNMNREYWKEFFKNNFTIELMEKTCLEL